MYDSVDGKKISILENVETTTSDNASSVYAPEDGIIFYHGNKKEFHNKEIGQHVLSEKGNSVSGVILGEIDAFCFYFEQDLLARKERTKPFLGDLDWSGWIYY